MTETTGFTGIGAQLKMGDGVTPTEGFTHIGNTTSFTLNQTSDQIDATHLQSTSGFREFKQGFKTFTVDFEGHFDPDNPTQDPTDGIMAAYASGAKTNFQADFSTADNAGVGAPATNPICSFSGVILQLSINVSEGMVTYTGSISSSAAPVWGDGTP